MTSTTEAPGRREANKARTREAITTALRELVQQRPVDQLTVDQVADAAGISRRTFFNYFGSIPAVLTTVFEGYAAQLVDQLDPALVRTDPVQSFRLLVQAERLPEEMLSWLAVLNRHGGRVGDSGPVERAVWSDLAAWLEGVLRERLPQDADPLYIATLAAGVMSTFAAAEQAWLTELPGSDRPTPGDLVRFHQHLDRALGYLASGWRAPA